MADLILTRDYRDFVSRLKEHIKLAQTRAVLAVNAELVQLYWQIGSEIIEKQAHFKWGSGVIERLACDLKAEFPGQTGFSVSNLKYMRQLAEAWTLGQIGQAPLGQLSWYHHLTLLGKLKSTEERLWYAKQTAEQGWSRNVLVHQIESGLINRQGNAQNNFAGVLPPANSDLVSGLLKDPVNLSFLEMAEFKHERQLERALIHDIRKFLLELGKGFAFLGEQTQLTVGGEDFFTDLLFYHTKLHCYVVIELKMDGFKPEYEGKMRFYINTIDEQIRDPDRDDRTIGIILCKSKNRNIVEMTLRGSSVPVGVSTYTLSKTEEQEMAIEAMKEKVLEVVAASEVDSTLVTPDGIEES